MSKFQELVQKTGATPDDVLAVLLKLYKEKLKEEDKGCQIKH